MPHFGSQILEKEDIECAETGKTTHADKIKWALRNGKLAFNHL